MQGEVRRNDVFKRLVIAFMAIAIIGLGSCRKASAPEAALTGEDSKDASLPGNRLRLSYRDSILYFKSAPTTYLVRPMQIPRSSGYFTVNPEGLEINASNGTINVNNSEAGLLYKIYYVGHDNVPIDSTSITIAGIDYEDGIYEIRATAGHDKAVPVYHGTSTIPPCTSLNNNDDDDDDDGDDDGDDDDDGGGGNPSIECVFDETDLNGDGQSDVDGVNLSKLRVNKNTGAIDLEQSFNDKVFGSSNPANGLTKDFTIHYRLSDASQRTLNKIKVRLYHYSSRDKIPAWLLEELRSRKENYESVTAPASGSNMIQSNSILSKPKRPPLIIIVSGL